jgi:hypothetical protein
VNDTPGWRWSAHFFSLVLRFSEGLGRERAIANLERERAMENLEGEEAIGSRGREGTTESPPRYMIQCQSKDQDRFLFFGIERRMQRRSVH